MTTKPGVAPRYERVLRPEVLDGMRRAFRRMNRGMLLIWRLGFGWSTEIWPAGFGRLMVVEHVGRKSGTPYRTPVNFTRRDGDIFCLAGFGAASDWYRNLMANPDIAIWLPDGRWTARADEASDAPDRLETMRRVLIDSGFAARAVGLDPHLASDDALDDATATYRLIRITPVAREDADGPGPGDLVWVWYPVGGLLALLVGARCRRRGGPR